MYNVKSSFGETRLFPDEFFDFDPSNPPPPTTRVPLFGGGG